MPQLSVVVPVHNERDNIVPLVEEIVAALRGRLAFEIVYVDDASGDDSLAVLREARARFPELRVLRHLSQCGQSTAVRNGVKAARGAWIATLDGDGQNDPADIPKLLAARDAGEAAVKLLRRLARRPPDDAAASAGPRRSPTRSARACCATPRPIPAAGIKLFEREAFLDLPYFDHMHRYPAGAVAARRLADRVSVPVNHRAAHAPACPSTTIWNRAWVGIVDLRGVGWLIRRAKRTAVEEMGG